MKLTNEQIDNVRVLVDNEVTYLETYREVFDHMVTAMETRETLPDLQRAYREILEEDFGGPEGLRQLESEHNATIRGAMREIKEQYFSSLFTWPGIVLPAVIATVCCYGMYLSKMFDLWLYLGTLLALVFPFVFIGVGNLILYITKSEVKRSVKNNSLKAMAIVFFWYYVGSCILGNLLKMIFLLFKANHATMRVIDGIVILVVFMYTFLYAIAAYKAYTKEFKMRLTL